MAIILLGSHKIKIIISKLSRFDENAMSTAKIVCESSSEGQILRAFQELGGGGGYLLALICKSAG